MPPLTLACRALGILLAKMIFGATFPNYFGVWEDFHAIHQMRIAGLKARLSETGSGVSEGTHHISLACELVEACLQQIPEDRQVLFVTLLSKFVEFRLTFIPAGTRRRSCCIGCVCWRRGTPSW